MCLKLLFEFLRLLRTNERCVKKKRKLIKRLLLMMKNKYLYWKLILFYLIMALFLIADSQV